MVNMIKNAGLWGVFFSFSVALAGEELSLEVQQELSRTLGLENINQYSFVKSIDNFVGFPVGGDVEAEATKYLPYLNQKALCDDWQVAMHMLALIQAPQGRHGDQLTTEAFAEKLAQCPQNFQEFTTNLMREQRALQDYHTGFSASSKFGFDVVPAVDQCTTPTACKGLDNVLLYPVDSEIKKGMYVFALARTAPALRFLEIESIDGKNQNELYEEAVSTGLLSKTDSGHMGRALQALFQRNPLAGRSRLGMKVVFRDVISQTRGLMTTTYRPKGKPLAGNLVARIWNDLLGVSQVYACKDETIEKSESVQACITQSNQIAIRLIDWMGFGNPELGVEDSNTFIAHYLEKNASYLKSPLLFDIRSNPGGSPGLVTDFICRFGDDRSFKEMKRRHMVGSKWPSLIKTSSGSEYSILSLLGVEKKEDLYQVSNGDLVAIDDSWIADATNPDAHRRTWRKGFLDRWKPYYETEAGLENECLGSRHPLAHQAKWVVLTHGREFSATENFLSFIEHSMDRFKIVGATTWGGTGAPIQIELPHTKAILRLSQARHIDGMDGSFNIEGVGVKPHNFISPDTKDQFENRLKAILNYSWPNVRTQPMYRPYIVKFSQSIKM